MSSDATPVVAALVRSPSARLVADLDPSYRVSTGRLVRIRGPIEAQRIIAAVHQLSTSDELAVQADTGAAGCDPFADAVRLVTTVQEPEPGLRARLYELQADDRVLLLAGDPAYVDHQIFARWGMRLRGLLAEGQVGNPTARSDALDQAGIDDGTDWAYWRERLSGELARLDLTGRIATGASTHGTPGRRRLVTATQGQARRWHELAARLGADPEVLALTAICLLLRRYLPESDHVLAVAVAGPPGCPETMLPLRIDASRGADLAEMTEHVAERLREALDHRRLDPADLVRRLNLPRVVGRTLLDDVHVVLDRLVLPDCSDAFAISYGLGLTGADIRVGRLRLQPLGLRRGYVPGELRLSIATRTATPQLAITVPPGVPGRFAAGIAIDIGTILDDLADGRPAADVLAFPAVVPHRCPPPVRAHHAGRAREAPAAPRSSSHPHLIETGTIAERFRAAAATSGRRAAVLSEDGAVSYADLEELAGGFAAAIAAAGGGRGHRVGLLLDQGVAAIAAMLGTLAAGAAYVPLDPSFPDERLRYIRQHAEISVLVTTPERAAAAETADATADVPGRRRDVAVVCAQNVVAQPLRCNPQSRPDDPAYLLYTSGSTGRPKGVMQTHRGVLAGIANHIANFAITPDDRLSMLASFSYDMAISDLYGALLAGAAVAPVDVRRHGLTHLIDRLAQDRVTIYHSTPTLFRYLTDAIGARRLPTVRAVLLGGEESTGDDVRRARRVFARDCVFVNGYGATEATFAVQNHLRPADTPAATRLAIGYPLTGYQVELRDPQGRSHVLAGELVIRSRYVAPGYWRDPELTAQRFGVDDDGTPWYRSGDLARRLPDGRLLYLGRLDRQVKVRGYRVELGEIEAVLAESPTVARAVAFARPSPSGEPELNACVQVRPGAVADGAQLRSDLARRLPDFAVPRAVVVCDRLPLTATGKVDVAALPVPLPAPGPADAGAPQTGTERMVAAAWQTALGVPEVGVTQNFFDAGGHSLLMAMVQQQVARDVGRPLPLVRLFAYPTIRGLAAFLDAETGAMAEPVTVNDSTAVTTGGPDASAGQLAQRMARRRHARSHLTAPARREVAG